MSAVEEFSSKLQELCELPDKVKDFIHQAEDNWLIKLLHLNSAVKAAGDQLIQALDKVIEEAKKHEPGVKLHRAIDPLISTWDDRHIALTGAVNTLTGRDMRCYNEKWGGTASTAYGNTYGEYSDNTGKLSTAALDCRNSLQSMKDAIENFFVGIVAFVVSAIAAVVSAISAAAGSETIIIGILGAVATVLSIAAALISLAAALITFNQGETNAVKSLSDDLKDDTILSDKWKPADVSGFNKADTWTVN